MITQQEAVLRNRKSWEARTKIHLNSPAYQRDIELLRGGYDCLAPPVREEIGDVHGLKIAHLQCHIGTDSLALARKGAEVWGLDFSPASIEAAQRLALELGIDARFVTGDAMRADEVLPPNTFDAVIATFGVICWIPDMARWMRAATALLKPSGRLYLCDGHPLIEVFEDDPANPGKLEVAHGYFDREAMELPAAQTYADDGRGEAVPATAQYQHTVGDLLNGMCAAGLCLDFFHEFPAGFFRKFESMKPGAEAGAWELDPPLRGKLPFLFSLSATKP